MLQKKYYVLYNFVDDMTDQCERSKVPFVATLHWFESDAPRVICQQTLKVNPTPSPTPKFTTIARLIFSIYDFVEILTS